MHASRRILLVLAALFALSAIPALAQDMPTPSGFPEFLRCSGNAQEGYFLHGAIPAGVEVELIGYTGTARCTATVREGAADTLVTMNGPVDITRLGSLPQCPMDDFAVATTTPGLELEDLFLPPVYPGYDPSPFFAPARDAILAQGGQFEGYGFNEETKVAGYLNLTHGNDLLNLLRYEVGDTQGGQLFTDANVIVAVGAVSAQAFKLGCGGKYKLFRLGGELYLTTTWRCCSCGGNSYNVYAWNDGTFQEILANWDLDF